MFVRNQPPVICPLAADGRAYPVSDLVPVLQGSACSVKHIGSCDIPARYNLQVADFHADCALPAVKPPQEITPDCIIAGVLQRGYCDTKSLTDMSDAKSKPTPSSATGLLPSRGAQATVCVLR
jgi:hypothetical protein